MHTYKMISVSRRECRWEREREKKKNEVGKRKKGVLLIYIIDVRIEKKGIKVELYISITEEKNEWEREREATVCMTYGIDIKNKSIFASIIYFDI